MMAQQQVQRAARRWLTAAAGAPGPSGRLQRLSAVEGAAGVWRTAFIKMPHFRTPLVSVGAIHDTFETAIT